MVVQHSNKFKIEQELLHCSLNIFTVLSIGERRKYILVLYTNDVVYLICIPKALSEINTAFVEQEVVRMRLRKAFLFLTRAQKRHLFCTDAGFDGWFLQVSSQFFFN